MKALSISRKICPSFEGGKLKNIAPGRIFAKKCPTAMQKGMPSSMATHQGETCNPRSTVAISACVANVLAGKYEIRLPVFIMRNGNRKRASIRFP
jgi:hypothetical protein